MRGNDVIKMRREENTIVGGISSEHQGLVEVVSCI
jgi:hypothetical protein